MKQENLNRLTAASTTVSFCEHTASDTASIPAFAPLVALIKSKIAIVQGFNQISDAPTKGITLNTTDLRQSMIQHTYPLANAIRSYGASLNPPDFDLIMPAKLSLGYLENLGKEECATECQRICTLAAHNAAGIASFGAPATDITDAQNVVNLYMASISHPRGASINRTSAVRQANINLSQITNNLLTMRLDTMANTLRFKNPEWWSQYHLSRKTVKVGRTHTKLHLFVKDQFDTPLKNAILSLLQNNSIIYTKKTSDLGTLSLSKIKPGDYDLRVERKGFTPHSEPAIHFAPASDTHRTVTLAVATG